MSLIFMPKDWGGGNNVAHGEQLGDIVARFVGHTQVFVGRFEPLVAGAVDGASDVAFTPVVGGKGERPVAEQSIEILQIVECGIGGCVNVVPAVVNRCFFQAVMPAGSGHELPQARCADV